jgi:hypothetical protein
MISNFQGMTVKIPPGAVRGNFRLLSFAIIGNWNKVAGDAVSGRAQKATWTSNFIQATI